MGWDGRYFGFFFSSPSFTAKRGAKHDENSKTRTFSPGEERCVRLPCSSAYPPHGGRNREARTRSFSAASRRLLIDRDSPRLSGHRASDDSFQRKTRSATPHRENDDTGQRNAPPFPAGWSLGAAFPAAPFGCASSSGLPLDFLPPDFFPMSTGIFVSCTRCARLVGA